jgi:hypothetical protein
MLTKEDKARISDYFDSWELVAYLQLDIADVIEAFEDDIEDALDDINELIGLKGDNDNEPQD